MILELLFTILLAVVGGCVGGLVGSCVLYGPRAVAWHLKDALKRRLL